MRRTERWFLAVTVILLAVLTFGNRLIGRPKVTQPPVGPGLFLSSGSFCPLPPGESGDRIISTTNLGTDPVHLTRWSVFDRNASEPKPQDVAPRTRASVPLTELGPPGSGAVVEVFGAASTTDAMILSPDAGVATSRCTVQPSNQWFFASASTLRGHDTFLLVENPFREEAIVQVRFLTPDSDTVPARLSDFLVPQTSQVAIFLAEYFPETDSFGLEVAATRGRVAVSRYSSISTRDGWRGIFADVGIREPSERWFFGGGELPADGDQYLRIINPGQSESLIQIIFQTETEQLSVAALQELPVAAGRQVTVKVADHIPRNTRHGVSVASINQVPVIVERQTFGSTTGGRGVDSVFGVPSIGRRWVVSVGSPRGGSSHLSITNFGNTTAVLRVSLITGDGDTMPPELSRLVVEPGLRATADITPYLAGGMATAIVEATAGEVAVEHHLSIGDPIRDFADQNAQSLE